MDLDAMRIGVYIRKGLIFTIRTCYGTALNHPFVLGMVFFFILLYRSFPTVFGLLVSSSPVLVSTAVLLGTLLSFGHPNIPEVEKEEQNTHEIASLKAGIVEDDLVVEKDESFSVETRVERRDIEEEVGLDKEGDTVSEVEKDDGLVGRTALIEEESEEIHGEKRMIKEKDFCNSESVEKREFHEEKPLIEGLSGAGEDVHKEIDSLEEKNDKPTDESLYIDLEGPFDSSLNASWKRIEDHAESSDSGSDHSESSSPDASLADIMPMLDELHPLLDSEIPQPALISLNDSDAASEQSPRSNNGSAESEEVTENEEEEVQVRQEDGTESLVRWTEDDEKNLMDLGTSELERNQRLENLIARRRARKILRMEAEKNLIDLESNDLPFQIAPISTRRRNPFDLPYDSIETMGLPPIPGSAPSVLLPRRNPFDLPYDPHEEKPNLMGDSFQQEFVTFHQKDMHFRRHESFSLGASFSGELKQERHNTRFRPYFVMERVASEGMSYPTFQRQSSEISDSKMSSAPETESLSWLADPEDQKELNEQELPQERELITHIDCAPDHLERESHSSEEVNSLEIDQEEKRDIDSSRVEIKRMDMETAHEMESSLPDVGSVALPVALDTSEIHVKREIVEEQSSGSSSSTSSEANDKIFHMKANEGSGSLEISRGDSTEGSADSMLPSLKESDPNFNSGVVEGVDDRHTKEPVYDLSPSAIKKTVSNMTTIEEALFYVDKGVLTSSSSISSDKKIESSEVSLLPVEVERDVSPTDGESILYKGKMEKENTSDNEIVWTASSHLCGVDENESRSMVVNEISERDVIEVGLSRVDQNSDDPNAPIAPKSVVELEEGDLMDEEVNCQIEKDQVHSSSIEADISVGVHQDADENPLDSSYPDGPSEYLTSSALDKQLPSLEKSMIQPSSDDDHEESQNFIEEASVIGNVNEQVVQEPEDKDQSNLLPTFVSTSIPSEDSENILGGIESEDRCQVLENLNYSRDAIGFPVMEEKFNEETEGIKEIDEGFLLELDTVGDFSVKEMGSNMNQFENQLTVERESLLGLEVLDAKYTGHIEGDSNKLSELEAVLDPLKPMEHGVRSPNLEGVNRFPEVMESNSELQVLEASSLEDIDSSFKEFLQGEIKKPAILESARDEPMPKETEIVSAEFEITNQDPIPTKISSEMMILEARSLDNIDMAFKQLHEGNVEKPMDSGVTLLNIEGSVRYPEVMESTSELDVLEASSLKDIDSSFKEFLHGEVKKPIILESVRDETMPKETEIASAEFEITNRDPVPTEISSEMLILEARSLEDIDSAFKQLHEGEVEKAMESGVTSLNIERSDRYPKVMERTSELQVLKASSLEDIDSSFEEFLQGVVKKPKETEVGSAEFATPDRDPILIETSSELPVLKARSLADIDSAFKQLREGETEKSIVKESFNAEPIHEENKVGSTELGLSSRDPNPIQTNLELPVLEARSVDRDLTFKQLHEGDHEKKPVFAESVDIRPCTVECKDAVEIDSDLQVVEARSFEDIPLALKQLSDTNVENLPKPLRSKDGSGEIEAKEVESATQFEDAHLAQKQLSEDNMENLPKTLELTDGSDEVEAKEVKLAKEIKSSFEESSTQETSTSAEASH
ncbi:hypothetical protein HHK36_017915 [Tetracentron sinense]|uniref:Uncharacterized protein n=1 Tax=Tetracentron sinense TaxID=13715 RepID=A0A834YZ05_TETSI|nr:hypothetical protein HHK36_017915 [Tetracentron sinense]